MNGKWIGIIQDDAIYDKNGIYKGFVVTPKMASYDASSGEVRSPEGEYVGELLGNMMGDYKEGKYILRTNSVAQIEFPKIDARQKEHLSQKPAEHPDIESYAKEFPSPSAYHDVAKTWL
jgi:hypothetical protein